MQKVQAVSTRVSTVGDVMGDFIGDLAGDYSKSLHLEHLCIIFGAYPRASYSHSLICLELLWLHKVTNFELKKYTLLLLSAFPVLHQRSRCSFFQNKLTQKSRVERNQIK